MTKTKNLFSFRTARVDDYSGRFIMLDVPLTDDKSVPDFVLFRFGAFGKSGTIPLRIEYLRNLQHAIAEILKSSKDKKI